MVALPLREWVIYAKVQRDTNIRRVNHKTFEKLYTEVYSNHEVYSNLSIYPQI